MSNISVNQVQSTQVTQIQQNVTQNHIHIHNAETVNVTVLQGDQVNVAPGRPAAPIPQQAGLSFALPQVQEPSRQEIYNVLQQLKQAEGNNSQAEEALMLIKNSRRPYETLQEAAQSYLDLIDAEGSGATDQVVESYRMINSSLRVGESRSASTRAFLAILNTEGTGATDQAQESYRMIDRSLRVGELRGNATMNFLDLLRAEGVGSTDQAQENYRLIDRLVGNGSRTQDTAFFIQILNDVGSGNTASAQRQYQLYK